MSSQNQTTQTFPGRNPRRRSRKDIEDTGSLRLQPVRKRHKTSVNGTATATADSVLANGYATAPSTQSIPVRQRANIPGDLSLDVLAKNENFTIGQFPGLPKELRHTHEDYRGYLDTHSESALALTRSTAYVWNYSSSSPSSPTKSVRLPTPTRQDDPLSFGSLVNAGSRNGTGLLVIHPRSGKVTYWENLDNADALSLFAHRRTGTEGSIGLYTGETVVNVESAHAAGFVVTTSGNRVAQVQLKDSQSRPSINVQFLRAPTHKTSGSFLGGFFSALTSSGLLRDVVATRVQKSSARKPAQVLIASKHGQMQQWELSWSEPPRLISEWDQQNTMRDAVQEQLSRAVPSTIQEFNVVDIDYLSTDGQHTRSPVDDRESVDVHALCLYSFTGISFQSYAVGSLKMKSDGGCVISTLINLSSYAAPLQSGSRWQARLCAASPHRTAFVVFERAITTVSLTPFVSGEYPSDDCVIFQDTTYLKDESDVHVVGAASDSQSRATGLSAATLLIRSAGTIKIVAEEPGDPSHAAARHSVSIRSKIEQAVLYGTRPTNPFNLSRRPELTFNRAEIEDAVLSISNNVLQSTYSPLTRDYASVDHQISRRIYVLETLAKHVKDAYPGLSRTTRWQLLWNHEKLAAARVVNALYNKQTEEAQVAKDELRDRQMLLPEMVEHMDENARSMPQTGWDQVSHFAYFLMHDTGNMSRVLSWTYNGVYQLAQDSEVRESKQILWLVRDATQIACGIIESALQCRQENAWLYDLENENLKDGILESESSYEGLPCPWTSVSPVPSKLFELAANAQTVVEDDMDEPRDREMSQLIAAQNPRLISAWCLIAQEHIGWSALQPVDSKSSPTTQTLLTEFNDKLSQLLRNLAVLDQTAAGMRIAEKYKEMAALTTLVRVESTSLVEILNLHRQPSHTPETVQEEIDRLKLKEEADEKIKDLERRIKGYHEQYGYAFTNLYYGALVAKHAFGSLLKQARNYKKEVRSFLRAEPNRRPLAWINDVLSEQDYAAAGENLTREAITAEQKAWNRGIELGFAKLALLAADEKEADNDVTAQAPGHLQQENSQQGVRWQRHAQQYGNFSRILQIQADLWSRIRHLTYNALDEESKIDLLMESLGRNLKKHSRDRSTSLLNRALANLIADDALDAESLVDILTLVDGTNEKEPVDLGQDIFFLALLAVQNDSTLVHERREVLAKLCWRRAMLADQWKSINKTISKGRKSDDEVRRFLSGTVLYKTFLEGYKKTLESESEQPQMNGMVNGDSEHPLLAFLGDMPAPSPEQCLTAGARVDDWVLRFGEDRREMAMQLAKECEIEEDWLRDALDKHQLERWWSTCRQIAAEDARSEASRSK